MLLWSLGTEICLTVLEDVKERGMHPLHAHTMLKMLVPLLFRFAYYIHILCVGIKAQNDMLGLRLLSGKAELSEENQVVIISPR